MSRIGDMIETMHLMSKHILEIQETHIKHCDLTYKISKIILDYKDILKNHKDDIDILKKEIIAFKHIQKEKLWETNHCLQVLFFGMILLYFIK